MEVKIKADIYFSNIDKPNKPFTEAEWKATLKDFTEADEVEILEVSYWDSSEDDLAISWDDE